MKQPDNWHTPPEPGVHREEHESAPPMMHPPGFEERYYPTYIRPRKKWLAALLAAFVPGTGHMYLGLMSKGIFIMMMLALNICGIVYFGIENEYDNKVLIILLLSLMVPIIYFYNLFSVLQCADIVNERRAASQRQSTSQSGLQSGPQDWSAQDASQARDAQHVPVGGIIVLLVAAFFLFQYSRSDWGAKLPHVFGSITGAIVLIGIGALVWFWERRGHSHRKD